jgi:hypothetical protein
MIQNDIRGRAPKRTEGCQLLQNRDYNSEWTTALFELI